MASAFNRLGYDVQAYQHAVRQSSRPGEYVLDVPGQHCDACLQTDPAVQVGTTGGAACPSRSLVDVDSELIGITRRLTRDPNAQYLPDGKPQPACPGPAGAGQAPRPYKPCARATAEDTRLSNPGATLRCTGWNRWEWLCEDPQARALVPFDHLVNYRLVARDNHRPHVAAPLDQTAALPPGARSGVDRMPDEMRWWREGGACIAGAAGGAKSLPFGGAPAASSLRTCGEVGLIRSGCPAAAQ